MKKILTFVPFIAIVLILAGCANELKAPEGPYKGTNVILISLDTCRLDYLEPYGSTLVKTPNLNTFANDAIVMENAITPVPMTVPAHASLFTGLHPIQHGMRDNFNHAMPETAVTLAELFWETGYSTAGVVGAILLNNRMGFAQGFDFFDDEFDANAFREIQPTIERKADEVLERSIDWLENHQNDFAEKPFFLFAHFYDPHKMYNPPERFLEQYPNNPYAGEVAFVDETLGKMFDYLKVENLYEESIIIVLADHGEGLGDHGEETHGLFLYDEVMHVPMMIKLPKSANIAGKRIKQQVSLMDIMPTLIDLCALGPVETQGRSLQPILLGGEALEEKPLVLETQYPLTYNWSPLFALRTVENKYIHAPKPELYDLANDPGELNNLITELTEQSAQMKEQLEDQLLSINANKPFVAEEAVSIDRAEALASLGYAGGGSTSESIEETMVLPDPKDKIALHDKIDQALLVRAKGNLEKSLQLFEEVHEEDPNNPSVLFNLGMIAGQVGDFEKAQSYLEKSLEIAPQNLYTQLQLARLFYVKKDYETALLRIKNLVEVHPKMAEAHYWLGRIYQAQGKKEQALEQFEITNKLMPDMPGLRKADSVDVD